MHHVYIRINPYILIDNFTIIGYMPRELLLLAARPPARTDKSDTTLGAIH